MSVIDLVAYTDNPMRVQRYCVGRGKAVLVRNWADYPIHGIVEHIEQHGSYWVRIPPLEEPIRFHPSDVEELTKDTLLPVLTELQEQGLYEFE